MRGFALWITWRDPTDGRNGVVSAPYELRERCSTKELHPKESSAHWKDVDGVPIADFTVIEIEWEPGVNGFFGNETRPRPYIPQDDET